MTKMKIKTRAGICVNIRNSASNHSHARKTFIFFNKPVQTIELTQKEAILLGSSLLKGDCNEMAKTQKAQVP